MTIESLQLRGFRPVNSRLHKEPVRGIVGSILLEKYAKYKDGTQKTKRQYMSFVYAIKGQLRLGEPVPLPEGAQ